MSVQSRAADEVTIRRAVRADATELARLRWDFTAELAHADESLASFTPRFTRDVDEFLASGRWTIWVAECEGRLIGNLFMERVDKVPRPYERPASWGYVTNVYVEPDHRNAGTGRRLLEAAIAQARSDGWQLLLLWPSERSGEFYARSGFAPAPSILELELARG